MSEPAYHIILSPEAGADIEAIHEFIGKTSPQNAAAMVGRILDAITTLETFPHRNVVEHRSDKIAHAVRSLVVRPYIVYFRVLDPQRAVRILSVQHGARRRPAHFT